jgi:hypothetical protein
MVPMVLEPSRSQHDAPHPGSSPTHRWFADDSEREQPLAGAAVSSFRPGNARLEQVRSRTHLERGDIFLGTFWSIVGDSNVATCGSLQQLHRRIGFDNSRCGASKWSLLIRAMSTPGTLLKHSGGQFGTLLKHFDDHSFFRRCFC